MPPTDALLQNLRNEIAQGRVVVIIGAGVSTGATNRDPRASWTGLLESGIERCLQLRYPLPPGWAGRLRENIHSGDLQLLLAAAQEISSQLGAPDGGEYRRWLRETVGSLPLHDRTVLDALRDLPVILTTTNYDSLLEEATDLASVTWRDRSNVERVFRVEDRSIVHLHGFWNEPDSVILSLRSYEEISQDEHVQAMLRALRVLRTFLFVGCGDGLTDPNFGAFLRWSRGIFRTSEARHFRLCLDSEVAQVQALHPPEERIFALPYGPDHASLGPFLRSLAPEPSESLGLPPRALIVHHLIGLASRIEHDLQQKTYLPLASREVSPGLLPHAKDRDPFIAPIHQMLLEIVGRSEGGDSATAQIAAINRKSRKVRNILRTLDRSPDPLILLGEPGCGKTMTLQQAALTLVRREARRSSPRAILYLRLGEFHIERSHGRIGPEDVLRFVERESPPGLRPWIRRLAEAGRLVFFFDGMDEMSRDRYGDHTEALSRFAYGTKALFSCRITDFSPRFLHRRLVLLPFDRPRVTRYLTKYITRFPLDISGHSWSLEDLAQHIAQGDLPVQADNPFVLWLLCLYLQEERKWPASRVELLRVYNEKNYDRKQAELPEEPPFPPRQTMFAEWARIAYQITERNRGPDLPVDLLAAGRAEAEVREVLRVGKRCVVLAESREGHEHFVRFAHHRFQEYFAACHIHTAQPEIDWLGRLDAPRWQETMLNLVLLGGEAGPAQTLADSMATLTNVCRREPVREDAEDAWDIHQDKEAVLPHTEETLLADRVELCSRILRQSSEVPGVSETLGPPFREAVQLLAEKGNPITQVKMMNVSLTLREVDRIETVRRPLESSIRWVRDQALAVLAGAPVGGAVATGSDFATQMGYDLATGLFPSRLKAYYQAVRKARDSRHRRSLRIGSILFALNVILLCALAVGIYAGIRSLHTASLDFTPISARISHAVDSWPWQRVRPPRPASASAGAATSAPKEIYSLRGYDVLSRRDVTAAAAMVVLLAAIAALFLKPSALWAVLPGTSAGVAVFGPLALSVWKGSDELPRAAVVFGCLFGLPALLLLVLVAASIHFGSVSLFLAATARVRHSGHSTRSFFTAGWETCGFRSLFHRSHLPFLYIYLFPLAIPIVVPLFLTLDYLLPFSISTNILIIFGVPFLSAVLPPAVQLIRSTPKGQVLHLLGKKLAFLLAGLAALALILLLFVLVARWLGGISRVRVLQFMVGLIVATLTLALAPVYVRFGRFIARPLRRFYRHVVVTPPSMTEASWLRQLQFSSPEQQDVLLSQASPMSLALTTAAFLETLREIQPLIRQEPALSTYWELRNRLEQSLRQEKQG